MRITKPFRRIVGVAAVVAAATATVRRRQAQSGANALWRDATSDSEH